MDGFFKKPLLTQFPLQCNEGFGLDDLLRSFQVLKGPSPIIYMYYFQKHLPTEGFTTVVSLKKLIKNSLKSCFYFLEWRKSFVFTENDLLLVNLQLCFLAAPWNNSVTTIKALWEVVNPSLTVVFEGGAPSALFMSMKDEEVGSVVAEGLITHTQSEESKVSVGQWNRRPAMTVAFSGWSNCVLCLELTLKIIPALWLGCQWSWVRFKDHKSRLGRNYCSQVNAWVQVLWQQNSAYFYFAVAASLVQENDWVFHPVIAQWTHWLAKKYWLIALELQGDYSVHFFIL